MQPLSEQEIYTRERIRLGFIIHFIVFTIGIAINWTIWIIFPTDHIWPIWPTLGWGIGILSHYLAINVNPWLRRRVEKRVKAIINQNT